MPKFTTKHYYARDAAKPFDLAKRLSVLAATNEKVYKEVKAKLDERARPKQREKHLLALARRPVHTHSLSCEEERQIAEDHERRLWALEQASRLLQEEKARKRLGLLDRISEPGPSPLSRIGPAPVLSQREVEEQYGNVDDMAGKVSKELGHMQKEWRLKRTAEMFNLFKAVEVRLRPIGEHLYLIGEKNKQLESRISDMIKEFDDCYDFFEANKGQVLLDGKQFRYVKADLNRVKHLKTDNFKERYMEIALALSSYTWRFKDCC